MVRSFFVFERLYIESSFLIKFILMFSVFSMGMEVIECFCKQLKCL